MANVADSWYASNDVRNVDSDAKAYEFVHP